MIYISFCAWIFLLAVTAIGIYRLWTRLAGGTLVDWLMLPATVPAELLYSLGRLMTGRPAYGGLISPRHPSEDACRYAISGRGGFLVAMLSSFLTIIGGIALLSVVIQWLGIEIIEDMIGFPPETLPPCVPTDMSVFWDVLKRQITLLENLANALAEQNWLDWRTPLFLYGFIILTVRLFPVRHDARASIVTAVALAGLAAAGAMLFGKIRNVLEEELWYILTFAWTILLLLLCLTLLALGIYTLIRLFLSARGGE